MTVELTDDEAREIADLLRDLEEALIGEFGTYEDYTHRDELRSFQLAQMLERLADEP